MNHPEWCMMATPCFECLNRRAQPKKDHGRIAIMPVWTVSLDYARSQDAAAAGHAHAALRKDSSGLWMLVWGSARSQDDLALVEVLASLLITAVSHVRLSFRNMVVETLLATTNIHQPLHTISRLVFHRYQDPQWCSWRPVTCLVERPPIYFRASQPHCIWCSTFLISRLRG